jgi:hypothetical protein
MIEKENVYFQYDQSFFYLVLQSRAYKLYNYPGASIRN